MTLKLTTGDLWDEDNHCAVDNDCHPEHETDTSRRSAGYIGQFRERIPVLRAIRLKCGACMGGEPDRMPMGMVARYIDECGSSTCPLWPFRFGHDPWRPEPTEAQREAGRRSLASIRAGETETARTDSPKNGREGVGS